MIATADLPPILDRIQEWTRTADKKASTLAVIETGVATIIAVAFGDWFTTPELSSLRWPVLAATGLWVASVVLTGLVLLARTGKEGEVQDSVTFFAHVGNKDLLKYRAQVNAIPDDVLRDDYIDQIWICGKICSLKHKYLKWAIGTFAGSLAFIVVCYAVRLWQVW